LFDKHGTEQADLMDVIAERVQTLGGLAGVRPQDIVDETRLARAPRVGKTHSTS
jgi:starvation-inducible DNA-binding protein